MEEMVKDVDRGPIFDLDGSLMHPVARVGRFVITYESLLLLIIVIIGCAIRLYAAFHWPLDSDETFFLAFGKMVKEGFNPIEDRAHTLGYLGSYPVYIYTLGGWFKLVGVGIFQGRLLSVVASTCTIALVWQLGRRLLSPSVGLISSFLFAFTPFTIRYSYLATSDPLQIMLVTLSVLLLVIAIQKRMLRYWFLCGIAIGLGSLTTRSAMIFIPFVVCVAAISSLYSFKGPSQSEDGGKNGMEMISGIRSYVVKMGLFLFGVLIVFLPILLLLVQRGRLEEYIERYYSPNLLRVGDVDFVLARFGTYAMPLLIGAFAFVFVFFRGIIDRRYQLLLYLLLGSISLLFYNLVMSHLLIQTSYHLQLPETIGLDAPYTLVIFDMPIIGIVAYLLVIRLHHRSQIERYLTILVLGTLLAIVVASPWIFQDMYKVFGARVQEISDLLVGLLLLMVIGLCALVSISTIERRWENGGNNGQPQRKAVTREGKRWMSFKFILFSFSMIFGLAALMEYSLENWWWQEFCSVIVLLLSGGLLIVMIFGNAFSISDRGRIQKEGTSAKNRDPWNFEGTLVILVSVLALAVVLNEKGVLKDRSDILLYGLFCTMLLAFIVFCTKGLSKVSRYFAPKLAAIPILCCSSIAVLFYLPVPDMNANFFFLVSSALIGGLLLGVASHRWSWCSKWNTTVFLLVAMAIFPGFVLLTVIPRSDLYYNEILVSFCLLIIITAVALIMYTKIAMIALRRAHLGIFLVLSSLLVISVLLLLFDISTSGSIPDLSVRSENINLIGSCFIALSSFCLALILLPRLGRGPDPRALDGTPFNDEKALRPPPTLSSGLLLLWITAVVLLYLHYPHLRTIHMSELGPPLCIMTGSVLVSCLGLVSSRKHVDDESGDAEGTPTKDDIRPIGKEKAKGNAPLLRRRTICKKRRIGKVPLGIRGLAMNFVLLLVISGVATWSVYSQDYYFQVNSGDHLVYTQGDMHPRADTIREVGTYLREHTDEDEEILGWPIFILEADRPMVGDIVYGIAYAGIITTREAMGYPNSTELITILETHNVRYVVLDYLMFRFWLDYEPSLHGYLLSRYSTIEKRVDGVEIRVAN